MPDASLFAQLGLYVRRDCLPAESLQRVRAAVQEAGREMARVRRTDADDAVDVEVRRTRWAEIDPEIERIVRERYEELRPEIAEHLDVELTGMRGLQFLVYEEGDFFKAHRDNSAERAEDPGARKVSVLMFLNGPSDEEGRGFEGGELVLYGLLDDERARDMGMALAPEPGLLIAFPADLMHSVEPVASGTRYTVVAWYT